MTHLIRRVALAGAGALAALVPVTAAHATGPHHPKPKVFLTAAAECTETGWAATFRFTNASRLPVVVEDVVGDIHPALPLTVAPGDTFTGYAESPASDRAAYVVIGYRFTRPAPTATPTTVPAPDPAPTDVPPAPNQPPPTPDASTLTDRTGGKHLHKIARKVWRPRACKPTPTTPPTTTPTTPPTQPTTPPPTQPTTAPPPTQPTTAPPTNPTLPPSEPTDAPPPPLQGPASGGGSQSLPLTGAAAGYTAAGGIGLLAVGLLAVWMVRRRRTTFSA